MSKYTAVKHWTAVRDWFPFFEPYYAQDHTRFIEELIVAWKFFK